MKRNEILEFIKTMAKSQGFYGRILAIIEEREEYLDTLVRMNFADELDLIMFLEC